MKGLLLASTAVIAVTNASAAIAQQASNARPDAAQTEQSTEGQSTSDPSARVDGEIVVTATRRAERLQDVPISITAFSQDELNQKGIVGYETLARETPGVVLNKQSANFANFSSRGIANNTYGANLQSTVAVYIDELPITTIGNATTLDPALFDVDRVEILRGPQGTLFGSGSLSGAIRILNKNPDLKDFHASGLVDIGLTGSDSVRQRYNAMINVPLVDDKLGVRAVGFYRHEDGWLDNVGTGVHNSNTLVDWGGRVIALAKPTDRLRVRLLASYEDSSPKDASMFSPSLGRNKRISDRPDLYTAQVTNLNATIDYDFGFATLTSSSTYSSGKYKFYVDLGGTFAGTVPFALDVDGTSKAFVEEARLVSAGGGDFEYVLGGFYLSRQSSNNFGYRSSPAFLAARGITGLPDEYFQRFTSLGDTHELAGFGELTYHVSRKVWLTGGLRYGGFDAQGTTLAGGYSSNYFVAAFSPAPFGPLTVTPVAAGTGAKSTAKKPSYKVSLSWKPSQQLTTYASVSTGFRTPVINAQAGSVSLINPADLVIPAGATSDNLTNYEVGAKGRWLNGALSANVALFWIDWTNIQIQANRVSDSVQFATNVGGARSRGLEFEITAQPTSGLSIGVNGAWIDAKVTKLSASEAAISGAVLGARLASPRFQGAANIRYNFPISGETRGFASIDAQHIGSYPNMFPRVPGNPAAPVATYGITDTYNNVNLSAGITTGKLTVTAYLENAFDDHSITYIHPEAFVASRYGTLRPRTVGVRAGYNF